VKADLVIGAPVHDRHGRIDAAQQSGGGERRYGAVADAFQVTLVGTLAGGVEVEATAEAARHLRKRIGARDQHEAADGVSMVEGRAALGHEQGDEAAERMGGDGIDGAVVVAHGEHRAGAVGKVRAPARAQPVGGKIKGDHAQPGAAQRLDESGHEGRFARPAVHEHHRAVRGAVGLIDIALDVARWRRHHVPARMAQVEARPCGEQLVISGAVLGQFGRAEDAERQVAGFRGRQAAQVRGCARVGTAQRGSGFFVSVSHYCSSALMHATGNSELPLQMTTPAAIDEE